MRPARLWYGLLGVGHCMHLFRHLKVARQLQTVSPITQTRKMKKRPPSRIISCSKPSRARRKPTTPLPVWTRVRNADNCATVAILYLVERRVTFAETILGAIDIVI